MYRVILLNDGKSTVLNEVSALQQANRIIGTVKQGINTINTFTFTIYSNHEAYHMFREYASLVRVENIVLGTVIFRGRVLKITDEMDSGGLFSKKIICECELGYLMDSVQVYGEYHDIPVINFLNIILNNHNRLVTDDKKFLLGDVTVDSSTGRLYRFLGYDKTLDTIKDKLIDRLGGELQVRMEADNTRYLDYVVRIGKVKNTTIELAKNLKTIERESDPTELITRLIPLGEKLNTEENSESEERLTIESVNNGRNYIDNEDAIAEFGIITGTEVWDDVTTAGALLANARDFLAENRTVKKSYIIEAVDLAAIGLDIDTFEVGNYYRVINPVMGIDEYLRVVDKESSIDQPETSTLTFGEVYQDVKNYHLNNKKKLQDGLVQITESVQRVTQNIKEVAQVTETTSTAVEQVGQKVTQIESGTEGIQRILDTYGDVVRANIANNLNTVVDGYVLDARQGAVLRSFIENCATKNDLLEYAKTIEFEKLMKRVEEIEEYIKGKEEENG